MAFLAGSTSTGTTEQLRGHFSVPIDEYSGQWDKLWERNELLLWDRGIPNPALIDALKERQDVLGSPVGEGGRRKRALVPGCGKGYDILLLAASGYDTTGLEISENALKAYKAYEQEEGESYRKFDSEHGTGSHEVVIGDFFKDEWVTKVGAIDTGFDLIYDYTFFCALPPAMRPDWARRMSELLAKGPDSRLICLEFPLFKAPSTGGPPHGMNSGTYLAHLNKPGEQIHYTADGFADPSTYSEEVLSGGSNGIALKRVAHWQPKRTHKAGEGTDHISVWKHW